MRTSCFLSTKEALGVLVPQAYYKIRGKRTGRTRSEISVCGRTVRFFYETTLLQNGKLVVRRIVLY